MTKNALSKKIAKKYCKSSKGAGTYERKATAHKRAKGNY
jgi:hypothetical protein